MNKIKKYSLALALFLIGGNIIMSDSKNNLNITKKEELKYIEADSKHFSGEAEFAILPQIDTSKDSVAIVDFKAGVINNWHTHSKGQYLYITQGEGRVQEWGKNIQYVKKGDVIWIPAGIKHWHGAGETTSMSHLVISPDAKNNKTIWLEKVNLPKKNNSKDEYRKEELVKHKQTAPLSEKQLSIAPIASLNAVGNISELKPAIEKGLNSGLTVAEIREIFTHQYAYAGFPRALNGMAALNEVLKERSEKGIKDKEGRKSENLESEDFYSDGVKVLEILTQRDSSAILWDFDGIDYALKAHLFGYLFSRENLSYVNRELTTVSTLSALDGVDAQLASHMNISRNLGLSKAELQKVADTLRKNNILKSAENIERILEKIN